MAYCSFPRSGRLRLRSEVLGRFITVFICERSCMDFSSCSRISVRKPSDSPCEAATTSDLDAYLTSASTRSVSQYDLRCKAWRLEVSGWRECGLFRVLGAKDVKEE